MPETAFDGRNAAVDGQGTCAGLEQAQHFEGAHAWVGTVEIGEPERTYTVEPLEDPVPRERPAEPAERPATPFPAEKPIEPERVRAP